MMYVHKDLWDSEESDEGESALDSVELLDLEVDVQDEEKWLYESPKKHAFEESNESALGWCRHILDNPSLEMEAARRSLIIKLNQTLNNRYYRHSSTVHSAGDISVFLFTDKHKTSERTVLHQECVFTPIAASPWRGLDPAMTSPSYFNTPVENIDNFDTGEETEALSSSCLHPCLSSPSSSSGTAASKQGSQSPRLSRLYQQVTQFKLLKLTENQGSSPSRTRSPLRTSLRSLQAVRNSRSLEIDEYQPAESQITLPLSGASPVRRGSGIWSPSHVTSVSSSLFMKSVRGALDRTTAVKIQRLQRSQSVSPRRIQHTAKGYLPVPGRVFATPERSTSVAWVRNAPLT